MELPNPILQSSEFSLLDASDSQIYCPSDSLSLPSEPPEIANWFPSYQYESPIIGTSDIFGDSVCEDSEIGKEKLCSNGSERAKEEESLRGLKELGKKDKVLVGDDKCEQQCPSENVESSCSPSLNSEPIDVKNWFSSYVYESPALDTSDGFRDSIYKESERDGDEFDVEESNREKAETNGDFQINRTGNDVESSDGFIEKADIRSGTGNGLLSDKSRVCFGSALKHCSEYAVLQNSGTSTSKDFAGSTLEPEDTQSTQNFSGGIEMMQRSVQKRSEKSRLRMENKKDFGEKGCEEANGFSSLESNLKPVFIKEESTRKSARRCEDKEDDGEEIANDGFVSTRKGRHRRASEENNNLETRRRIINEEYSTIGRKALAERTNFQVSSVTEITGKWKCPQKRKPNLGPPLKQLRLERWVHRS